MEVLNFKLPASSANRIRLHSISPRPASLGKNERSGCVESMLASAISASGALKRRQRSHFEFLEALQNYRAMRHGYRVFIRALEREKVRTFTVK